MYIAVSFVLVIAGSVVQVAYSILKASGTNESLANVLYFFDRINVGNAATYIGMGTKYTTEDVLYLTIPAIVGIFGFLGLGLLKFNKKDLK
jgi:hypothetical protein